MIFRVEFMRDGEWHETYNGPSELTYLTEAERLAAVRSEKTNRLYRVSQNDVTVSKWRNGNQLVKENKQ